LKRTEVTLKEVPRLERLPPQSLLGAMVSSGVGVFIILVLYAANIYAGYEVAIFRGQPQMLVAGLSAIPVLGLLAPVLFLVMPTRLRQAEESTHIVAGDEAVATAAGVAAVEEAVNPMQAEGAAHPTALKISHGEHETAKPELPPATTYQRGQFTFN